MYAGGLLGKRLGPSGFHRVRHRFLNDLADAMGPVDAHQTTVVFDAPASSTESLREIRHKGITVVFAVNDENADARIEQILAGLATPKKVTVVSSDRRVRTAAERRRARPIAADDFWVELDARRAAHDPRRIPPTRPDPPERPKEVSASEAEFWLQEFGELDDLPETREAFGTDNIPLLTDAEIAEIEREVEREMGL